MKKLTACLESQGDPLDKAVPPPPVPEKEEKVVVMQGPLSTIMALTLMKRYALDNDTGYTSDPKNDTPEAVKNLADVKNDSSSLTQTTQDNSEAKESTPQSLSMEMQMAYVDNVLDKVQSETLISQQEISDKLERYQTYFATTTRAGHVLLGD